MARTLRIEYEGAIYHVTCRMVGSWREGDRHLFRDDRDRWRFLDSMEERVELYGVRIHQYVLMGNHFHLVMETPRANCSAFVQSLLTSYAGYFNRRHERHGHLFDGRYKAKLVQGDEYLLALSRYVHLNPVRISNLPDLEQRRSLLNAYYWSSYLQYIGRRKKLPFVTYGPTLAMVGGRHSVRRYVQYVEQGLAMDMDEWGLGESSPLSIGDQAFCSWVEEKYRDCVHEIKHREDVAFRKKERTLPADIILQELTQLMECELSAFSTRSHSQPHRPFAAYYLTRFGGLSRRQTADCLGVGSGPAVSLQLSRFETLKANNSSLEALANRCEDVFSDMIRRA